METATTAARLTPIWDIHDVGVLLSWGFRTRVAEEAATGIELVASNGRSRRGTGSRYILVMPTPTGDTYHRFKAAGDRAAVAHAEAYLAKRARPNPRLAGSAGLETANSGVVEHTSEGST